MKRLFTVALAALTLSTQFAGAQDFVFNGNQLDQNFNLAGQTTHTVYEDHVIPQTCYRNEITDYRQECSTQYQEQCTDTPRQVCADETRQQCTPITRQECRDTTRQECRDTSRQECSPVDHRECTPITRQECSDVPRQQCSPVEHRECTPITRHECHNENRQTCSPVTRNECHDERVCHQSQEQTCHTDAQGNRTCVPYTTQRCENQNVCHDVTTQNCTTTSEQVCGNVPDQVCRTTTQNECHTVSEHQCHAVADQVCRTTTTNECRTVPDRVCTTVPDHQCYPVADQVCRTFTQNVCHTENDHQCQQVPRQVCNNVPVYGQVPFDCSHTDHVAVGEEVDFNIQAKVAVHFRQPPPGVALNERLSLSLAGEEVQLACNAPSNAVLLIATRNSTSNVTGPHQKAVDASFDVTSVETSKVLAPVTKQIIELVGTPKKVEFKIGQVLAPRFLSVGLKLVRAPGTAGAVTVFNAEIPQQAYRLSDEEVQYVDDDGQVVDEIRTRVTVDLSQLSLTEAIQAGSYSFTVGAKLNPPSIQGLLNPGSLPSVPGVKAEATYNLAP